LPQTWTRPLTLSSRETRGRRFPLTAGEAATIIRLRSERSAFRRDRCTLMPRTDFIQEITRLLRRTFDPRVVKGGEVLGAAYEITPSTVFSRSFKRPLLVTTASSAGFKSKIASLMNEHRTVGVDVVAAATNELIARGAEPLFLVGSLAAGELDDDRDAKMVEGIADGCVQAQCSLLGFERSEMRELMPEHDYALSAFGVGVVDRNRMITGKKIRPGDVVIGIACNGLYACAACGLQSAFLERAKDRLLDEMKELGCTLGEELLKPAPIYVRAIKAVLKHYKVKEVVRGIAHVSHGGIGGSLVRILPPGRGARIERDSWTVPPIFGLIKKLAGLKPRRMLSAFNMGIGMMLVVPPFFANSIISQLKRQKHVAFRIGKITSGERRVVFSP